MIVSKYGGYYFWSGSGCSYWIGVCWKNWWNGGVNCGWDNEWIESFNYVVFFWIEK